MSPTKQKAVSAVKLPTRRIIFYTALLINSLFTQIVWAEDPKQTSELIWNQTSNNGVFNVTLDSQSDDSIEINQFLEWILTIKTADGQPVTPARVVVGGGMPMHGHGLPSQPQVGKYLGDGMYLLKGLMFSMNGRWSIELEIQSKSLRDLVVFEIKLDY